MPVRLYRAVFHSALCAALLAFASVAFAQKTIHIPADQPSIQAGIDAAATGDTVLVAPGTYYEHIDFKGKAITVTSSDGAAKTIIDGSNTGPVVFMGTSTSSPAILSNFTLQRGFPDLTHSNVGSGYNNGGGVVAIGHATITGNTIQNNQSCGIDVQFPGVTVQGNHILTNAGAPTAGADCRVNGAGIIVHDTFNVFTPPAVITGNIIEKNESAGIFVYSFQARVRIEANLIRGNGIGQYLESPGIGLDEFSLVDVVGNVITANAGVGLGVGLINDLNVVNNTFYLNGRNNSYQYSYQGSELQIGLVDTGGLFANNIIVGNDPKQPVISCNNPTSGGDYAEIWDHNLLFNTVTHTATIPCMTHPSEVNLFVDPQLVNATAGDFHLTSGSPAIDAGNNSATALGTLDFDGNARLQDATGKGYPIVDIGAYEFSGIVESPVTTLTIAAPPWIPVGGSAFTVAVAAFSPLGIPTGPVTLLVDGAAYNTQNLNASGKVNFSITSLKPGYHIFIATYPGQNSFSPAISVAAWVDLNKYGDTLTIKSSRNPSLSGQNVTFTITSASNDTGFIPSPISLTDSLTGTTLGTVTPDASGKATFDISTLSLGTHNITATYAGDDAHLGTNASVGQIVQDPYATTTLLVMQPQPCITSQPTTFTATVTSAGGTVPTGSITFFDFTTALGSQTLDASGKATLVVPTLSAGYHTFYANYVPTGSYQASAVIFSAGSCISGYATNTSVSSSPNPSLQGQLVTFTAAITSANGTPTGSVQFVENQAVLFTAPVDASGHAVFTTSTLSVGLHTIYASYQPTGTFAGSSGQVDQNVRAITNAINLTSSLNPASYGDPITYTAYVTTNSGQTLTGNVTFYQGSTYLGQVAVDPTGKATLTLTNPTNYFGVGAFNITATFLPTGSQTSSAQTSIVQQVVGLPTTTLLTANPTTGTAYNNTITLTATVAANTAGKPTPTGSVLFYGNSGQFSYVPLVNGVATLSTTLPGGVNHLYSVFYPDSSSGYNGSTSNSVDVTINAAPSTLNLRSTLNPAFALTPFGVNAQMTLNGSQPAPASLQVTFTVMAGSQLITTSTTTTNAAGMAAAILTLPAGTYTVTASFAGNFSILASVSPPLTQIVSPLTTATTLSATPNPAYENQPVTFSVALSSAFPPNGTAVVYDGGTALQSLTFTAAQTAATFTLNNLSVGTHTLTAVFTPADGNFLPSTSAPLSLIILPQSFTVTLSDDTLTIVTGHHRSTTVSIASIGGLSAPFTLACGTNLPQWTSCQWGQTSLTLPANGTVSTSLTIDTNQLPGFLVGSNKAPTGSATSAQNSAFWNIRFAALPVLLLAFFRRRALRANLPRLMILLTFALAVSMVSACGANKYPYSTAPGTYSIPVVVTEHPTTTGSSPVTKTVTVTLIVTN